KDDRSMASDSPRAAKAVNHQRFVRPSLSVELCKHRHQEQDGKNHQSCNDPHTRCHNVSFESFKSSQSRTYAIPLSYRVTRTSTPLGIAVPSSLLAMALRRCPA